ncbi:hypothetical protein PIB30_061188 [Stylosanthes scabra]|uniref:Ribonuclease H1 N-terminal domain-containing protein n=1 Tax=Stylosanthes scabra TaxID=79078 RepID=A0ABU6TLC7_9FABA|nr:hypothetical protein [Stylosanthes scabra]
MAGTGNDPWFVVYQGRIPGIYPTSEEAEDQVTSYVGVVHSRHDSYEATMQAWREYSDSCGRKQSSYACMAEWQGAPECSMPRDCPAANAGGQAHSGGPQWPSSWSARESLGSRGLNVESSGQWHDELPFSHDTDDVPVNEGSVVPSLIEAALRLQVRVSQLEMERWELLIQVAEKRETIKTLHHRKDGKS